MQKTMSEFERSYTSQVNRLGVLILLAHIPAVCVAARLYDVGSILPLLVGLLLCAGPALLVWQDRASSAAAIAIGMAAMGFSALAIHCTRGLIETHFHIFVMICALVVYGRLAPILTAGITIALHHVIFWIWVPATSFNYKASVFTVLLHAAYVVMEVIPACWIAKNFGRATWARGMVSDHLGATSERVAQASQQILESGRELSASAAECTETIRQAGASSTEAGQVCTANARGSREALSYIESLHKQIEQANTTVERVRAKVSSISDFSREISRIVKLVDDLAFQTNILALNAAVEAARAGSAGQSFAVVANEFHALAQKSGAAGRDIAHLIERASQQAKEGQDSVQVLVLEMEKAIHSASHAHSHMSNVHESSEEQATVLSQINRMLMDLGQESQGTARLVEASAASSEQLAEQANGLREMVELLQKG